MVSSCVDVRGRTVASEAACSSRPVSGVVLRPRWPPLPGDQPVAGAAASARRPADVCFGIRRSRRVLRIDTRVACPDRGTDKSSFKVSGGPVGGPSPTSPTAAGGCVAVQ